MPAGQLSPPTSPGLTLVDVPPPEYDIAAPPFRPTLFIGLGGCGGKVLRRLRRRLDDRLIEPFKPLVPMLLLDLRGGIGQVIVEQSFVEGAQVTKPAHRPSKNRHRSKNGTKR